MKFVFDFKLVKSNLLVLSVDQKKRHEYFTSSFLH